MAEGLKDDFGVLGTIGIILVVLLLVSNLIGKLERRIGDSLGEEPTVMGVVRGIIFGPGFSDRTPHGTLVETVAKTTVYATPAKDTKLGEHIRGVVGRIVDGPLGDRETNWWNVDFDESPDGWVSQDDIGLIDTPLSALITRWRFIYLWVAAVVSLLALGGFVYARRQWALVTRAKREEIELLSRKLSGAAVSEKNERWEKVTELASSENPSDWRLAIIEADVMLEELVTSMGYHGTTLGDRLKSIEASDFEGLDAAWEAHKVRNRIAHHGTDFILTRRETARVVELYRQVFSGFDYI